MYNPRLRSTQFLIILLTAVLFLGVTTCKHAQASDEKELFLVAQKAFEDGFYDVAIRYINQLFEEYPQSEKRIQAKLLLGQCYFFQSQYLKAYDVFQELLPYSEFKDATLYWLGETYLKGSDYEKAKAQYRQLIDLYPASIYTPQARYSLGWSYFAQNKFEDAKKEFLHMMRYYPAHQLTEDASFKLAETEYSMRSYENAIQHFKNYVQSYPNSRRHAEAYFYIAESYYFLENYLTAVTYYAKTSVMAYDNKTILMGKVNLGWSYLKLEKTKLAQQYFDEAYAFAREKGILSDDVYLGQATFYAETGDHENALKYYKLLIERFPHSERIIEAYLGLANTYYQIKNYPPAIRSYRYIVDHVTNNEPSRQELLEKAYFGLAWAHLKSGDIDTAVASFEAIKNSTASKTVKISAMTQIGDAYQDVGQYSKAIEFYDKILEDFPDSMYVDYVQYRQGIALLKMENIEAATLSFQSLKANFPLSKYLNDVNYYLAVAHFKNEDWSTAKSHILEFIESLPKANQFLAEAHYILGLSHFNLREYKEAIKVFQTILKDFSEETALVENAQLYIAKCDYDMGRITEALQKFEELVEKYPKSKVTQEALMWLGDHYLEASEFNNAIKFYNKFITMFPGSKKVNLVYFELGRAHQANEQYEEAVNAFKQIDKKDLELYEKTKHAIADIFTKDLDSESAIQIYQKIIDASPEFKRNAYIKIAKIYTKIKQYENAVAAYQSALKAKITTGEHTNAELQFLIADAYQLLHQHNRAVEEYLKVSYLYPKDVTWVIKAYLRIARIFEDDEQWEDARTTYTKILKFETDESKFAQERLDWINEHTQP